MDLIVVPKRKLYLLEVPPSFQVRSNSQRSINPTEADWYYNFIVLSHNMMKKLCGEWVEWELSRPSGDAINLTATAILKSNTTSLY